MSWLDFSDTDDRLLGRCTKALEAFLNLGLSGAGRAAGG